MSFLHDLKTEGFSNPVRNDRQFFILSFVRPENIRVIAFRYHKTMISIKHLCSVHLLQNKQSDFLLRDLKPFFFAFFAYNFAFLCEILGVLCVKKLTHHHFNSLCALCVFSVSSVVKLTRPQFNFLHSYPSINFPNLKISSSQSNECKQIRNRS